MQGKNSEKVVRKCLTLEEVILYCTVIELHLFLSYKYWLSLTCLQLQVVQEVCLRYQLNCSPCNPYSNPALSGALPLSWYRWDTLPDDNRQIRSLAHEARWWLFQIPHSFDWMLRLYLCQRLRPLFLANKVHKLWLSLLLPCGQWSTYTSGLRVRRQWPKWFTC
jgi:hypothetical protein